MINQPASHRQRDLLVFIVKALEPTRVPQAKRAEVTALLKQLMTEYVTEGLIRPQEAADE